MIVQKDNKLYVTPLFDADDDKSDAALTGWFAGRRNIKKSKWPLALGQITKWNQMQLYGDFELPYGVNDWAEHIHFLTHERACSIVQAS